MGGKDTLILDGPSGATLSVAREWTDQATPNSLGISNPPRLLSFQHLLALAELVESLAGEEGKDLTNGSP